MLYVAYMALVVSVNAPNHNCMVDCPYLQWQIHGSHVSIADTLMNAMKNVTSMVRWCSYVAWQQKQSDNALSSPVILLQRLLASVFRTAGHSKLSSDNSPQTN
jgi:hypothetical protein